MAKLDKTEQDTPADDVVVEFVSLHQFADKYAIQYGVELMAGFFYEQEHANKFADSEENYHNAIKEFKTKEVK